MISTKSFRYYYSIKYVDLTFQVQLFPQKRYIFGTRGEVVRVLSECLKYQFVEKEIKP